MKNKMFIVPESLINIIKRIRCKHDYVFYRNIYGDEILRTKKYQRGICKCKYCGKEVYSGLNGEGVINKQKTI